MKVFFIGKDLKINMNLFQLGSKDIGIDLGTANVLVTIKDKGIVLKEPSVVAIDLKTNSLLAIGQEAKEMLGKTAEQIKAIRPLKDGVIADFTATQLMLKEVLRRISKKYNGGRPRIVVGVPSGITEVEERAVEEALIQAGAREVFLIEEPMAAAIGSNIEIAEPSGNLIVDIGGGTTEVAVVSLGGIVVSNSLNEDIINYIKREDNLAIGASTAEQIKLNLGCAIPPTAQQDMEVRGRDLGTGLPKTIHVTSNEIGQAMSESINKMVDIVRVTLEKTPPELASDIMAKGIVLAGGGALIKDIDKLISMKTEIPVYVAEEPLDCVVRGTAKTLENLQDLKTVLTSSRRR